MNNKLKIILIVLSIFIVSFSLYSCSKPLATLATETIKETAPPTTAIETAPPTTATETTPETTAEVEKRINAPEFEWFDFNQETKEYTIKSENNPWGFEKGEVIGIYTPKAYVVERLGKEEKIEDAIGLLPEVAKTLQEEAFKETGEFFSPLLINLEKVKDEQVKIVGLSYTAIKDKEMTLAFILPRGTELFSPFTGNFSAYSLVLYPDLSIDYTFDIGVMDRVGSVSMSFIKENMLLPLEKKNEQEIELLNGKTANLTISSGKTSFGELMASIVDSNSVLTKEAGLANYGLEIECQLIYNIHGKDEDLLTWDRILEKEGKKIYFWQKPENTL